MVTIREFDLNFSPNIEEFSVNEINLNIDLNVSASNGEISVHTNGFNIDLNDPPLFDLNIDFGFVEKVKITDRVKPDDELFVAAYPYFNVNEMLVVEELYKEAVVNTDRQLIIFNGELDRIRSGYYPSFFYPKLAALTRTLFPKMETVYYIHNFKGRNGGTLFRCYPGPWKVLRRMGNKYVCLHQQDNMPSLKEVALDILPTA